MGLLSLFKKNSPKAGTTAKTQRQQRDADSARLVANSEAQTRQREIARETALKIDAIEAAMANDIFNKPEPAWGSGAKRPPAPPTPQQSPEEQAQAYETTLAMLENAPSTELLNERDLPNVAVAAQTAPIVEEIAILYANDQLPMAKQMLIDSLAEAGLEDRTVWWMLFDFYMVTGQQDAFDDLSIDYASKFETSPPPWRSAIQGDADGKAHSGVTPTQAFIGQLDANITPALERLATLAAAGSPVLRLEFNRITGVEAPGCAMLLDTLRHLQAQERELILVAAAELAEKIRAVIEVGQRGDSEPCWLLLLELLQVLNQEKEFEEASMDYCVTFEVSPPPFVPPRKVAATSKQYASPASDRFMLPVVVEGGVAALLDDIDAYAEQYEALVFDCSRLARLDFAAASKLQNRLQGLAAEGKKIEFRDVNHLIAALLRLLSFSDIAKIFPHNY